MLIKTTPSMRRGVLSALAVASVLVLATGCVPLDEVMDSGSSQSGGSGSDSSSDVDSNSDSDNTDADADGPSNDEPNTADLTGAECLPGDWVFDNDSFIEMMNAYSMDTYDGIDGSAVTTFRADGTSSTHYDEWTHKLSSDGMKIAVERNGTDHGTYSVNANGTMSMTDTEVNSTTVMTTSQGSYSAESELSVFSEGAFVCKGDKLTIDVDGETAVMNRER